jgi:glycosyltransferase involved in cell wall biosynthesis
MRIGIMLRALDEKGGIGVYSHYITQELLELDQTNQYILFYTNHTHKGLFSRFKNVSERVISAPNKVIWDQFSIPFACFRERIDVLFHPKFTVPLLAPCKTVMVLHGAGWFIPEINHFWKKTDLTYLRMVMPIYIKKATSVLSVSQITTDTFNKVFNLKESKIKTVYFGPGKQFKRIIDQAKLQEIIEKYQLPDKFILTITGYDRGHRKNIQGILEAYRIHHGKTPHKLVVVGKNCHKFRIDYDIPEHGYGKDIFFPGWVDQEDLPTFYSLTDLFLYPSRMEAFPIPITEAMACGTPIITSCVYGLQEIAGEAALLVDPDDTPGIADAILRILIDDKLQSSLSTKALSRSKQFSWEKCARQTLEILQSAGIHR